MLISALFVNNVHSSFVPEEGPPPGNGPATHIPAVQIKKSGGRNRLADPAVRKQHGFYLTCLPGEEDQEKGGRYGDRKE